MLIFAGLQEVPKQDAGEVYEQSIVNYDFLTEQKHLLEDLAIPKEIVVVGVVEHLSQDLLVIFAVLGGSYQWILIVDYCVKF